MRDSHATARVLIGIKLCAMRKRDKHRLGELARRNPHLNNTDFTLAESGQLEDEAKLKRVVRAYQPNQSDERELAEHLSTAFHREVPKRVSTSSLRPEQGFNAMRSSYLRH